MAEPLRMCAGCRERAPKKTLIRVVRTPEGELLLDARDKAPGRGAYICRKAECLKKAKKSRALERALNITISEEAYASLEAALNGEL
ncbi:MAG: RNase P modulator RnpM [Oscillospiraceae bacterium]